MKKINISFKVKKPFFFLSVLYEIKNKNNKIRPESVAEILQYDFLHKNIKLILFLTILNSGLVL